MVKENTQPAPKYITNPVDLREEMKQLKEAVEELCKRVGV